MNRCAGALIVALGLFAARDASAACQGRPTDSGGFNGYDYGAAELKSYATNLVRVHYATSGSHAPDLATTRNDGVPDTVAYAGDMGELALTTYGTMGYKPVPSDAACPSNGGDEKVDIYLVHFQAADGSTFAECPDSGACSSFALVEAKFATTYANPQEGFRTVVTHELFHAEQNAYRTQQPGFWAEGTAQWAMKKVHPELQDFERQMPDFFRDPSRSIDSAPGGVTTSFLYGSAVWPLFLSIRQGDDAIRTVFETMEAQDADAFPAIETVLEGKGSSLAAEYPLFGAWNVGTGKQVSDGGYPNASAYPGIKTATLKDGVHDISSGFGYFAYEGSIDGTMQVSLDTDVTRNTGVVVPITGGTLKLAEAKALPANATGDVVVVVSGVTTKHTDAPFTVHIAEAAPEPTGDAPDAGAEGGGYTTTTTTTTGDEGGCRSVPGSPSPGFGAFALLGLVLLRVRRKT